MSYVATLYFKSGRVRHHDAPPSVDPDGRFNFGENFPRFVNLLDQTARQLHVTEPSQFIWSNPLSDEGELAALTNDQFNALKNKHDATMIWIPIEDGILTFQALSSRFELHAECYEDADDEYYISFEVACFRDALLDAQREGEKAFHIQCY